MSRIVVIGSINVDFTVQVKRLPQRGETIMGSPLRLSYGGKGANQAIAAARLGGEVAMIARVGSDDFGGQYLSHLRREAIDIRAIEATEQMATGSAMIFVEEMGQNVIVVSPAANATLTPEDVERYADLIEQAEIVVLQMEVPLPTVVRAIELANRVGTPVMLNPSPVPEGFPWRKVKIDYLVLNYIEAETIIGRTCGTHREMSDLADELMDLGVEHVIITFGEDNTLVDTHHNIVFVPTIHVNVVDTVGAGDAFTGALAVGLCEQMDLVSAVRFANCAGALAVTQPGAQTALPTRDQVEGCLQTGQDLFLEHTLDKSSS